MKKIEKKLPKETAKKFVTCKMADVALRQQLTENEAIRYEAWQSLRKLKLMPEDAINGQVDSEKNKLTYFLEEKK